MKPIQFSVTVPEDVDPNERFEQAKAMAARYNVVVDGDVELGTVSGGWAGSWFLLDGRLDVTITKRGLPIPQALIEKAVHKFLSQGS